jgi:2-oxoglutarate ferredoxin oxidoreductase subunit alpha
MYEFIDGNDAVVYGALDAGCDFFAGYPITPASPILIQMCKILPKRGGIAIQTEDEIASLGLCIGASVTGKKPLTASSGPGLSLYSENIGLAIMLEAPVVIINVQRQGPATGSATMGADGDVQFTRWVTSGGLPIIALAPTNVKECYEFTIECFNLAEIFRTPVFLLMNKELAVIKERMDWSKVKTPEIINRILAGPDDRIYPHYFENPSDVPGFVPIGSDRLVRYTTSTHDMQSILTTDPALIGRMIKHYEEKILSKIDIISKVKYEDQKGADTLIISYSVTSRIVKEAIRILNQKGLRVSHLIVYSLWPVPEKTIKEAIRHVKRVIVAEWNLGQYLYEIERLAYGKLVQGITKMNTKLLTPDEIVDAVLNHEQKPRIYYT